MFSRVVTKGTDMRALTLLIIATSLISGCTCTVLAKAGYVAASFPVRDLLIGSGLSNVIKSSSDSLYEASGYRYKGDQGTNIRKAVMKDHRLVEIGDGLKKRISDENSYSNEERNYSERLFGVLNKMEKNACVAKLLCEIGAEPMSFGDIGWKINHYAKSVPPVTWNSETFPYIEAFHSGLHQGRNVCQRRYNTCSYDLNRVVDFLWFFIKPIRL